MSTAEPDLIPVIRRLNSRLMGITLGMICGGSLFLATNWLVVRGGHNVGAHLGLLANYFPGYSVSFFGSLIGFVYAFVVGYGMGVAVAAIYTRAAVRA